MNVLTWLEENWATIVAAVGGAVLLARAVVKLTPTPKDNRVLKQVVRMLSKVGLYLEEGDVPAKEAK